MLQDILDQAAAQYNRPEFIADDPISLPHRFTLLQDIEIIAFWVSVLAWGRRSAIIKAGEQLIHLFENEPYNFIKNHSEHERKRWEKFYYRTFQPTDTLYFLEFLQQHYNQNNSLESAFAQFIKPEDASIEPALRGFKNYFFSFPHAPARTKKHIPSPANNATCKRLCLLLRWLVRRDENGVDFGLWCGIQPSQLVMPMDVHVERVARQLKLLQPTEKLNWKAALRLTEQLKQYCPEDPVRYDFALFGLGVNE